MPDYRAAKNACLKQYDKELEGSGAGQYEEICNKAADRAFDECIARRCQ
jgi:hypothetical protein